jgi:hypothetical protein
LSDALASMFRMPLSFGPAPGPRNLPEDKRHLRYEKRALTISLSARTDPDQLRRLLPEGFQIEGDARLEVVLICLSGIGWLAGRSYNIVMVRIPARWQGNEEVLGHFVPVLWENMADPILTGREELGWPKIFADISAIVVDGHWRASAAWDGFRFFELDGLDFIPADTPPPVLPMMFHKYIPRTGEWGQNDADYFTVTAPDGPPPRLVSFASGAGCFSFRPARWEDMPTQYRIVNALAELPLGDFAPATLCETFGGGDASGQRRLR